MYTKSGTHNCHVSNGTQKGVHKCHVEGTRHSHVSMVGPTKWGPQVPRGRTRHCHLALTVGSTYCHLDLARWHPQTATWTHVWDPPVGPTADTWTHLWGPPVGPTGFSFLTFRIRQRLLRCISLNYYCITMRKQRVFERCFITRKHCFMGLKQLAQMQRFRSVAFFKKKGLWQ